METTIREKVQKALKELFGLSDIPFVVEQPNDLSHGDYSTNVALVVSKHLDNPPAGGPKEIAEALAGKLATAAIGSVSVAGPGFINFTLKPEFFNTTIQAILEDAHWGKSGIHTGKKILVEHSSPNLFKPFHIGHVMNNTIGESIARLAEYSGATVTKISYPSDISLGIAKAVFILLEDGVEKLDTLESIDEKLSYLGECYVRGTKRYDEDESIQSSVRHIVIKLYSHSAGTELEAYEIGKTITLEYFKAIVARLGSQFDDFIYESEAGEAGLKLVTEHTPAVFTKSDGAIVYEGENDGLHTRVFVNKEGHPTYEAKDVGLLSLKFERFSPDLSIFITDYQQEEYFKVVVAAAGKINKEWQDKTIHRVHGRMSFKGQKMSSRLGGVPLAQTLLDTVQEEVCEKSLDISKEIADSIGIAAIKFSILRSLAGKNIDFDPNTSLSFEGDSGPYLQYSAVRAYSIIAKAEGKLSNEMPKGWEVTKLEKILIHFPEIVERSILEWAPHHVVSYLLELAQAFNSWYGNTKIIDDTDPSSSYKVALTKAFADVVTSGLSLLAIKVPEKM